MKKIVIVTCAIFAFIMTGIFLINTKKEDTQVTKQSTKVGVLLNGSCQDASWSQSHYAGLEKSAKVLNLAICYRENVPETEESLRVMEEMIQQGCKIIICNSFRYGDWLLESAKKHPDIYYLHASGVEQANNLCTYFGRIYQMRYLSGIVAGLQTETNEIGYVAALPISEVNRGINAFTLGVREVNPKAKVHVKWSNSWTDEKKSEKAARTLLAQYDIDVLAMHTDTQAPLQVAEKAGIWSIGYNWDNSEKYPKSFLTAPVWKWETFYESVILECLQGKFRGRNYWLGVESGILGLSSFTKNVKEGIEKRTAKAEERLQSGKYDVFYGPIKDQDGVLRVKEGESMSDAAMLNEFDWYVEGVYMDDQN